MDHMATKTSKSANPLLRLIVSQTEQIRNGGLPVLARKILFLFMAAPSAVVLLLVLSARPLVLIRFGRLTSKRIGPFASRTELYLCQRDSGIPNRGTLDFFYHDGPACNQQLKKMCIVQ